MEVELRQYEPNDLTPRANLSFHGCWVRLSTELHHALLVVALNWVVKVLQCWIVEF